jgi:hypothetical protein
MHHITLHALRLINDGLAEHSPFNWGKVPCKTDHVRGQRCMMHMHANFHSCGHYRHATATMVMCAVA